MFKNVLNIAKPALYWKDCSRKYKMNWGTWAEKKPHETCKAIFFKESFIILQEKEKRSTVTTDPNITDKHPNIEIFTSRIYMPIEQSGKVGWHFNFEFEDSWYKFYWYTLTDFAIHTHYETSCDPRINKR